MASSITENPRPGDLFTVLDSDKQGWIYRLIEAVENPWGGSNRWTIELVRYPVTLDYAPTKTHRYITLDPEWCRVSEVEVEDPNGRLD